MAQLANGALLVNRQSGQQMENLQQIPTATASLVDDYWANFLDCDVDQLVSNGAIHCATTPAHTGFWAIARCNSWVVRAPTGWPPPVREQLFRCFQPNQTPDGARLQAVLDRVGGQQLYGPALIMLNDQSYQAEPQWQRGEWQRGEWQPGEWQPGEAPQVRALTTTDHAQVAAFQVAASPIFWSLAEPLIWPKIFGVFVEEQLVAACGVRIWGELLAELYIDTVPTHWRRGYGKIATSAALHWVHTQTTYLAESVVELANVASWRLMHNVGFTPYAYLLTSFVTG